jgi:carbamoyltransferase
LEDGEITAFAEEERFTRIKLATNTIPVRSSAFCLDQGGLTLKEIDAIAVGWGNNKYPDFMRKFYSERMSHPEKDEFSDIYEQISLMEKIPAYFEKKLEVAYRKTGYRGPFPKIHFHHHHLSHAYSVYYPSPFDESIIIVVDGSGEEMASSVWLGRGDEITFQKSINLPHSLGYFYAALTEFLGFSVFTGEGKVMGLAACGAEDKALMTKLDNAMWPDGDEYRVNPEFIYFAPRTYSFRFTDKLTELLGIPPRLAEEPLTEAHNNLAWAVQNKLERIMAHLVLGAIKKHSIRNICLAGGVAMNCKMNGYISGLEDVEQCFVFPASTDSGCALGGAFIQARHCSDIRDKARRFSSYCGPVYSDQEIEDDLKDSKITSYHRMKDSDLLPFVARRLREGAIVGWHQGRMEVGARALGNRSILADPSITDMKDKINREVKHREEFRPFAPAILEEFAEDFIPTVPNLGYGPEYAWMLKAVRVNETIKRKIPAVVHVDGTIRPQVVSKSTNELFHGLLSAFYDLSGLPVLLNTSFNTRGEPIVCTPKDAIRCFYSTGLDICVLGNYVIDRP